jgi:hypothetical protein
MGSQVFPQLPGLDIQVQRESIYSTKIYTSASGEEQRTSWWPTPRFRYQLRFNFLRTSVAAPAPWQADSEAGVILQFLDDHRGAWDSFVFADPYDGVQRQVRFEQDTLVIQQVVGGVWEASFSLISLK